MSNTIQGMEKDVFGERFERAFTGEPGNPDEAIDELWQRFYDEGEAVGRTNRFRIVHDGETGHTIMVSPIETPAIHDPLEFGV